MKKILLLLTLMYIPFANCEINENESLYLKGIEEAKKQIMKSINKKIYSTYFDLTHSVSIEDQKILRGKLNLYYLLQAYLQNEFKKDYWLVPIETFDN